MVRKCQLFTLRRKPATFLCSIVAMANWWSGPEKPVPQGAAKGDYVTPTQPFSELSFRPKKDLSGADMWGATMFDQLVSA